MRLKQNNKYGILNLSKELRQFDIADYERCKLF